MTLTKESHILLVDDSPAILATLKDVLHMYGYDHVSTAESVEDGLKLFDDEKPDVVFVDLMMPGSSGVDFTKRALARNPASEIVLTTALPSDHEAVIMAISQGAKEYLAKPIRPERLEHVLDHLKGGDRTLADVSYR